MSTRKRWRWLLSLALLVVLAVWGGWSWVTRPEPLRLVARIVLPAGAPRCPLLLGAPGGLYVRVERSPHPSGPATLALIGWDGQPRWTVTTPLGPWVFQEDDWSVTPAKPMLAALSPDGRVFAIVRMSAPDIQVQSWRDGRFLGQAAVRWPAGRAVRPCVLVTNNGCIWLYPPYPPRTAAPRFRLWAIDGTRVAAGQYTPPPPQVSTIGTLCSISPDGTALASVNDTALCYATLLVQGSWVRTIPRVVYSTNPGTGGTIMWLDGTYAQCSFETLSAGPRIKQLGPDGVRACPQQGDGRHRQYPPRGRPWIIPTHRIARNLWSTPDQRTVLLEETGQRALSRWPLTRRLPAARARLALYTLPGRLRAVGPASILRNRQSDLYVSPDGRHFALLVTQGTQREIRVYGWKK